MTQAIALNPLTDPVRGLENTSGDTAADTMGLAMDLTGEVQGVAGIYDIVNANSVALDILGFTSVLSVISGPLSIRSGLREVKIAQVLNDLWGEIKAWINTIAGGFQTAAGAVFAGMSTALMVFYTTASKAADVANRILGQFGVAFSGAAFFCGAISHGMEIPKLFHCFKMIRKGDLAEIRAELKDPVLLREWQSVMGEELVQKLVNAEPVTPVELLKPIYKEILRFVLFLASTILTIIELFAASCFPVWALGAVGAALGLVFLLVDGYDFFTSLGEEKMELWEKALVAVSGIFCLSISILANQFAADLCEQIATILAGALLTLAHLIVITNNGESETADS